MNICIFGDSVTWGARLPFRIGWANLLRNYLERTTEDYYSVYDLGIDGDTTKGVLKRFDIEALSRSPEIIIFAIGANDALYRKTKNNPETTKEDFEKNVQALITKARKFTNMIFFVGFGKGSDTSTVPLPRSSTGKCYDKENTQIYNTIVKQISEKEGVGFIDVNSKFDDADFDDGLHPNGKGHKKIFYAVKETLNRVLNVQDVKPLVVVDAADTVIGYSYRNEIPSDAIVRVSALWLTDRDGLVLIARRSFNKRRDPGKWGPAAACILEKGHTYQKAILQTIEKEISLTNLSVKEVKHMFIHGENKFFCTWFSAIIDSKKTYLTLNPKEVIEIRWVTKNDLDKEVKTNPFKFVQSFHEYMTIFENPLDEFFHDEQMVR